MLVDARMCAQRRVCPLVDQAALIERDADLLVFEACRVEVDDIHIQHLYRIADSRRIRNSQDRYLPVPFWEFVPRASCW